MDIIVFNYMKKNFYDKNYERERETIEGFSVKDFVGIPGILASFLVSVFASFLCWNINADTELPLKIFYSIIAFFFSGIYLLYYLFMHYSKSKSLDTLGLSQKRVVDFVS